MGAEAQLSSEEVLKEIRDLLERLLEEAVKIRRFHEEGFDEEADEVTED